MTLKEKLDLWVKITGVNPEEEKTMYTIHMDGRLSDYDIKKMNDKIMESLREDETGIFTESYLAIYFEKFIKDKKITMYDLIMDKSVSALADDIKKLYTDLQKNRQDQIIVAEAQKAMAFYDLPYDLDVYATMEIRMSAIKCMKNNRLKLIQLSSGTAGEEIKFDKTIYMYRDMDALSLSAARGHIDGVSLAFIHDNDELTASYFGFIIKNGRNLWFLTDMPTYVHPLQKSMIRCPGRDMSIRIDSNFFPYDSIGNIDTSDLWDKGRYGAGESGCNTVVKNINDDSDCRVPIGDLSKMHQDEAFWTIVMVSLIKDKFYSSKDLPQIQLSYTKSMIVSPLITKNDNALTVQRYFGFIALNPVTIDDTKDMGFGNDHEEKVDTLDMDYLIDRYKDQIDPDTLNIIAGTESAERYAGQYKENNYASGTNQRGLRATELSMPQTEEQAIYNHKWMVRYNYALSIQKLIKDDYDNNSDYIKKKVKSLIENRLEEICIMHLKGDLPSGQMEFEKWYKDDGGRGNFAFLGASSRYPLKAKIRCALTGDKAGVVITVHPMTLDSLLKMCGVKVDELPQQIQNWNPQEKYRGNSILDNIDPMLWVCDDPFNKLRFDTVIALSKKKYLELCAKAGIEPVKFWLSEKPVCFRKKIESDLCNGSSKSKWNPKTWKTDYMLCNKCEKCKWLYKKPL